MSTEKEEVRTTRKGEAAAVCGRNLIVLSSHSALIACTRAPNSLWSSESCTSRSGNHAEDFDGRDALLSLPCTSGDRDSGSSDDPLLVPNQVNPERMGRCSRSLWWLCVTRETMEYMRSQELQKWVTRIVGWDRWSNCLLFYLLGENMLMHTLPCHAGRRGGDRPHRPGLLFE
jgi:hypothetical protein